MEYICWDNSPVFIFLSPAVDRTSLRIEWSGRGASIQYLAIMFHCMKSQFFFYCVQVIQLLRVLETSHLKTIQACTLNGRLFCFYLCLYVHLLLRLFGYIYICAFFPRDHIKILLNLNGSHDGRHGSTYLLEALSWKFILSQHYIGRIRMETCSPTIFFCP